MIIKRNQEDLIKKSIEKYSILFITGPRQSGKTTLCRNVFKDFVYKNLEDPETRLFAKNDPKNFLSENKKIVIDEIQRVPELLSYIQVLSDDDNKKKFVLTGSQNILIANKISQSLAGRVAIYNLLPFSMSELKNTNFQINDLYKQIFYGFYPRIYNKNLDPSEWYKNYIQTYLERDVREIKNIINLIDFQRFLRLCAGRTGQILNLLSLSKDVGVSVNTIKSWLSILEATYIIYLLPPYFRNFNKRIIKSPKLYFYDCGLVCSLLGINNVTQLKTHPLIGSIFETLCIGEILKQNYHKNMNINFYYWRDKTGNEIDVIFEKNNIINAIEIKLSKTFLPEFVNNLNYLEKITKSTISKKIICTSEEDIKYKDVTMQNYKNISF